MKITAHEVLLLQAAVNELIASGQTCPGDLLQTAVSKFSTAIRAKVEAGDYWLASTLATVENLEHKLHNAAMPHRSQGIGEAA